MHMTTVPLYACIVNFSETVAIDMTVHVDLCTNFCNTKFNGLLLKIANSAPVSIRFQ